MDPVTRTLATFAYNLRELRERAKLTQAQLAAKAGVNNCSISYWELGTNVPTLRKIVALAHALDVPITAFFLEEKHA